jgi:hypothetical protein
MGKKKLTEEELAAQGAGAGDQQQGDPNADQSNAGAGQEPETDPASGNQPDPPAEPEAEQAEGKKAAKGPQAPTPPTPGKPATYTVAKAFSDNPSIAPDRTKARRYAIGEDVSDLDPARLQVLTSKGYVTKS